MRANNRIRSGMASLTQIVAIGSFLLLGIAVAVPMASEQAAARARARALGDVRQLAADVFQYYNDTGVWPAAGAFAFTDGDPAAGEEVCFGSRTRGRHIARFLVTNRPPVRGWRGPYISISRPDPWGHRYVIATVRRRRPGRPVGWVLSAGPDGLFQTTRSDERVRGDDVGLLLR